MVRNLVRFNPFAELASLADPFFDDNIGRRAVAFPALPTLDVFTRDDDHLVVEAHLPNFAQDDVTVNVDRGALVIQAEKHEREEDKGKKYVLRESSTSFYRRIALPEQADEKAITAEFDKGVLRIGVPFKALPSPTKVAITAPAATSETATPPSAEPDVVSEQPAAQEPAPAN
jgi:HSP20 family protein